MKPLFAYSLLILVPVVIGGGLTYSFLAMHTHQDPPMNKSVQGAEITPTVVTPTATLTQQPTAQQLPVLQQNNDDPIINCIMRPECEGSKYIKKSLCYQQICCQVGDHWSIYLSTQACTQAQNNSNTNTPFQSMGGASNDSLPIPTIPSINYQQLNNDAIKNCIAAAEETYQHELEVNKTDPYPQNEADLKTLRDTYVQKCYNSPY